MTVEQVLAPYPPSDDETLVLPRWSLPSLEESFQERLRERFQSSFHADLAESFQENWRRVHHHRLRRPIHRYSARQAVEALVALVAIVLLAPVLIGVALAVKLTSPGPVLFRQERLGLHRGRFDIIKFRTMTTDNDDAIHRKFVAGMFTGDLMDSGEHGIFKLANDPRITRIGGLLRRTSLDELPQLWNVVRGEMSLVGPRPVLAWEAELFPRFAERRFAARPGMTGLWQVSGRSQLDYNAALQLDVSYVERKSLWLDLVIIARTVGVVLNRSSAR